MDNVGVQTTEMKSGSCIYSFITYYQNTGHKWAVYVLQISKQFTLSSYQTSDGQKIF